MRILHPWTPSWIIMSLMRSLGYLVSSSYVGIPGLGPYHAARSMWSTSLIRHAIENDGVQQIVLLGAGLATHAHAPRLYSRSRAGVKVCRMHGHCSKVA